MKIKEKYPNIIKFEKQIHASYKQFIGDRSLNLLSCYLDGFSRALSFHENEDWCNPFNAENMGYFHMIFQRRIEEKYQCLLAQSLENILRFHSDSEEDAFELYYKELDIFCEEDVPICEYKGKRHDDPEVIKTYGKIRILGEDIEANSLKNEKYQDQFYQELWKILIMIKRAPAMIIRDRARSLILMNAYINGFSYAYHLADQGVSAYSMFPGFEEWVNQKAGLHMNRPWYKVIMFQCSDDESSFDLFYKYLEEYVEKID